MAAPGDEFQSRVSAGLRRKSPWAASLKPACSTSSLTTFSSMRCRVAVSETPLPSFALESMTTYAPPGCSALKIKRFMRTRSTGMLAMSW